MESYDVIFAVLARVNPALPPVAATRRKAISKIAAAGWIAAIFHMEGKPALARMLIDERSEIPHAHLAEGIVIGSGRKRARDDGGHFGMALRRVGRPLGFGPDPRGLLWALGFPKTLSAAEQFMWLFVDRMRVDRMRNAGDWESEAYDELAEALVTAEEAVAAEWEILESEGEAADEA